MKVLTQPVNDTLTRDLRRYQVRLRITATGVLIFTFWGIVRNILSALLNIEDEETSKNVLDEMIKNLTMEEAAVLVLGILIGTIIAFMLDCSFRVIIYVLARRESLDPNAKRRKSYIILAWLMILGSLWSIYAIASATVKGNYDADDCIISVLIEFTSLVTLGELIDAAHKLRKLRDEAAALEAADGTDQNLVGATAAADPANDSSADAAEDKTAHPAADPANDSSADAAEDTTNVLPGDQADDPVTLTAGKEVQHE